MHPICLDAFSPDPRVRIRALMILLSAERHLVVAEIAAIVRQHEETVRRWLARYAAEGTPGLADAPRSGTPPGCVANVLFQSFRYCVEATMEGGGPSGLSSTAARPTARRSWPATRKAGFRTGQGAS